MQDSNLQGLLDELVDLITTVTGVTAFGKVEELLGVTTVWRRQLEWPQEVRRLLEVWSDGEHFVDQVFDTDDADVAERLLDDRVVGQWDTLTTDLAEPTLVDQLTGGLEVWVTVRHEWFDQTEHVDRRLVELDEDAVLDLTQTEQLQDLAHLWRHTDDTTDTDHERELRFRWHEEVARALGLTAKEHILLLDLRGEHSHVRRSVASRAQQRIWTAATAEGLHTYLTVFLDVLLSRLERDLADLLAVGLFSDSLGSALSLHLLDGATLLKDRFWDKTTRHEGRFGRYNG